MTGRVAETSTENMVAMKHGGVPTASEVKKLPKALFQILSWESRTPPFYKKERACDWNNWCAPRLIGPALVRRGETG